MERCAPAKILISQHATIPHYRVRFFELLEQYRPKRWEFQVVFDTSESESPRLYLEHVDYRSLNFPILPCNTRLISLGRHRLIWQDFLWVARRFDAIITDNFMSHITYVMTYAYRFTNTKRAVWGHVRDRQAHSPSRFKQTTEALKQRLVLWSDFFFAYTPGECELVVKLGFPRHRVVVLNNTIDITRERRAFCDALPRRNEYRKRLGVDGKIILLYVGRLWREKRVGFLLKTMQHLHESGKPFHLFVVGAGEDQSEVETAVFEMGSDSITYFGPLTSIDDLAPIYIASDMYVIAGAIGLAPLNALCYDLPVVAFDLSTHGPEIEYLTRDNSVILPAHTTPDEFARQLPDIATSFDQPATRFGLFPTIQHLTIESMVERFIHGVDRMLEG